MAEPICPVCGCTVVDGGYQKEGTVYCCESCATGGQCQCGCGTIIEKEPEADK
ncbi:MAG TPA: hypothetical protein G4N91_03390 [Dehalococcoidia bacterium]|nr:hypothetical protein [Dehalococcoidia bacterium]